MSQPDFRHTKSIKTDDEEFLEPVARYFRFRAGIREIEHTGAIHLVDIGCGPMVHFYHFACRHNITFNQYTGIDPLLADSTIEFMDRKRNITLLRHPLEETLPLPDECADYVVGFAFLEHIDHPQRILDESVRILNKHGKAIFTTPSRSARVLLEFLSHKPGLISSEGVAEHKTYFSKQRLLKMAGEHQATSRITHRYFELGLNNLLVIEKIR